MKVNEILHVITASEPTMSLRPENEMKGLFCINTTMHVQQLGFNSCLFLH
jgi:hypothetical protein